MRRSVIIVVSVAFILLVSFSPAIAGEKLLVAVAANFILPSGELTQMFEERTGIPVEATYTSTGKRVWSGRTT